MLRSIATVLALSVVVLGSPILKNVYLYFHYEHGRETLAKIAGPSDSLVGIWEGTFDNVPCGMDQRTTLNISLGRDSSGHAYSHSLVRAYMASLRMYTIGYRCCQRIRVI